MGVTIDRNLTFGTKIGLTKFALTSHFVKGKTGTYIDMNPKEFLETLETKNISVSTGYADFCKIITVHNFTDARPGTIPLDDRVQYIVSHDYKARTEDEIPVLSRWVELHSFEQDPAKWLHIVVYSKEQIEKEGSDFIFTDSQDHADETKDWGIVAIMAEDSDKIPPPPPTTLMRNVMGTEYGGSGYKHSLQEFNESVEFWRNWIKVKYKS